MVEIVGIVSAVSDALTDLAIMPYVLAGAVIALVGRLIVASRKAAR